MRASSLLLISAFGGGLAACEPTEECIRLQEAVKEAEDALAKVELRALMREKVEDQRAAAKKKAKKILTAYGLDRPEEDITAMLEERAAKASGVTVERTTRQTKPGPKTNPNLYDTVWRFEISKRPLSRVFDLLDTLAASPPVTRLSLFSRDEDGSYVLELTRVTIPEAPFMPEPAPLPEVPDISKIPAQWGFCGAGRLRKRIQEIDQQIAELKPDADATTVAMPIGATWDAKGVRAQQKGALERGGRSVLARVLKTVDETGLRLIAVGIEDDAVVFELSGRKDRVRAALKSGLPEKMAERLEVLPSPDDRVQRFSLPNPAYERMKPPGSGAASEAQGRGLGGLPPPDQIREQYERSRGEGHAH
jgi:hypothetical protein